MLRTSSYANRVIVPSVIELHPVISSTIEEIGYDELSRTCAVRFLTGDLYHVYPVERRTFISFEAAESKGRFYNQVFKNADGYTVAKIVQQSPASLPRIYPSSALDGLFAEFAESESALATQRAAHARLRDLIISRLQSQ